MHTRWYTHDGGIKNEKNGEPETESDVNDVIKSRDGSEMETESRVMT